MMYYRLFLQSQKNPFAPVSSSLRADTKKQKCSFREKTDRAKPVQFLRLLKVTPFLKKHTVNHRFTRNYQVVFPTSPLVWSE